MEAPTLRRRAAIMCAGLALLLCIDAGWMHAKAWLAQHLLADAWAATRSGQGMQRPWPWADTYPVARLRLPAHAIDQIVLAGDSGRSLAFGPGWAEASAAVNAPGTTVISGHRDTHFAFLREVRPGDEVELDSPLASRRYRVVDARIADTRSERIALHDDAGLLLVTCWPFDALVAGGPLRYVVRAVAIDDTDVTHAAEAQASAVVPRGIERRAADPAADRIRRPSAPATLRHHSAAGATITPSTSA